jgi:hypothetical protein
MPPLESWVELLKGHPGSSVLAHPRLVLCRSQTNLEAPCLYAAFEGEAGAKRTLTSLAALVPKSLSIPILPGLRGKPALRGRYVVGNQVLGGNNPPALAAFLDQLADALVSTNTEAVLFEDVEVGAPLWIALGEVVKRRKDLVLFQPGRPQPHWWIVFGDNPKQYWSKFSGKSRYNLKKKARLLDHSIVCYRDKAHVAEFLAQAHDVSKDSWQSCRLGLRIRNTETERRFVEEVAACGGLRSYVLQHAGRPLAFLLGYQWAGCFTYEEVGFRPEFAKQSPGTVLLYRALEDLLAQDSPRVFDFGFGDAAYKQQFANHQTMSGPLLLVRRSLRARLILRLAQMRRCVSTAARAGLKNLRLHSLFRKLHRS